MKNVKDIESPISNESLLAYETAQLPAVDPLDAIETLVKNGLTEYYWVYSSDNETKIALDAIGEVILADDKVQAVWDGEVVAQEIASEPFEQVGRLLNALPIENWRAYGYVTFDTAGYYYLYPYRAPGAQMRFVVPRTELVVSEEGTVLRTLDNPEPVISALENISSFPHAEPNAPSPDFSDKEAYETGVAELTKDIRAGKLTKAILSRSVKLAGSIDIFSTFAAIQRDNPPARNSRNYCFNQPGLSGIGSSPELLMETTYDGRIRTTPLAGTRPRSKDSIRDAILLNELKTNEKEKNEHVISVEWARKELERICALGSVTMESFMKVAPFRTVQHLSSSLSGQLAGEHTSWDGLRALFPGVTVSGIDKDSSIQTIGEREQRARGAYAGCVGCIDSTGASDFAISLRSAFEDANGVTISAGAGIVAESDPAREYQETIYKMLTIWPELVFLPT